MFYGLFICQHVSTSVFFLIKNIFNEIILERERNIIDKFWLNKKSSLGLWYCNVKK